MNITTWYFNQKGIRLFLFILMMNFITLWITRTLLMTETVFYHTFSERLTYERALTLFENMNRLSWVTYAFYPLLLISKITLVSVIIYLGAFLLNTGDKISLGPIFRVVLASEVIFILANLCKFLWFYFLADSYDLFDFEFFYPLSLINFFGRSEVLRIWIYPMQTVNVFHLIYILLIAVGLRTVCQIKKSDSEKVMLLTYIPAVIIWQALVMFILIGKEI